MELNIIYPGDALEGLKKLWAKAISGNIRTGCCMPESVTSRPTRSHEKIFLLSKSPKYYYDADAIKEPTLTNDNSVRNRDVTKLNNTPGRSKMKGLKKNNYNTSNMRNVWQFNPGGFKESHFAVFPEKLIVPCIKAGCPVGGVVLDPFAGAGTVRVTSKRLGRNSIGFELNPEYIDIADKRYKKELGMFI